MNYGASKEEWSHFSNILSLTEDLLPVVSNPDAEISPESKMKEKGKTPSRYNKNNKVAGIHEWTSYKATSNDIELWQTQLDYGICIQTRNVRALDIDINDHDLVKEIINITGSFPTRSRDNSAKCLLAFRLEGEMPKRVLKVKSGIIEFLANGQQFIAAGTHPSGVKYEWKDGLPEFPTLTLEQFEALWAKLVHKFAIEDYKEGSLRNAKITGENITDDDMISFLKSKNLILERGKDKSAFITCPFKSEHTSDSGITATAYFPAGGRGYNRGHFKCLHAHCAGRTDDEFETALGFKENDFAVVVSSEGGTGEGLVSPPDLPPFQRNKMGMIEATVLNVRMALERPDFCGWQIRYDAFKGEVVLAEYTMSRAWRPFKDTDFYTLRMTLEKRDFKPVSKEMVRDAMFHVANENSIDTASEWLNGLDWDGKARIEQFMIEYMKCVDTPYSRAIGRYIWTALAGRALVPGLKVDMVPIFEGKQGVGKSRAVAAMVPDSSFHTEIGFHETEDNLSRKVKGMLIAEISELRGLHTRDLETIKSFVTKTHEKWVPKYMEAATSYPRRLLFIGTTNQKDLLADETGNRRWLPINVGSDNQINVEAISTDRDQLWAEGKMLFLKSGVQWKDAQRLAEAEHAHYTFTDIMEDQIVNWLEAVDVNGIKNGDKEFIRSLEVIEGIGLDKRYVKKGDQMKVAKIITTLGWIRTEKYIGGDHFKCFIKNKKHNI